MHYLIKDIEFEKILNFLMKIKGIHKNNIEKLRNFIEAIYYACRSGCQWRLLPTYYGKWRSIHKRFKNWSDRGIWEKLFEYSKQDPDMEWAMIDSTIIRAHACSSGYGLKENEALGRSSGGFSTKIHAVVDALGNPLKFSLTAGQRHDITQAKKLSANIFNASILGDTAYDCDNYRDALNANNCKAEIRPRKNRKKEIFYDKELYKERHAIECFFGKIKHFRRIFSRFDKAAKSYLSFLYFVGALIWIK